MKRFLAILMAILFVTADASATNGFVRGNASSGSSQNTVTLSSVTAGDLIAFCVESGNTSDTLTVSGSVQGSLTSAHAKTSASTTFQHQCFYHCNATVSAGTETFTVSGGSAVFRTLAVTEYSGIQASSCLDGAGASATSTGTAMDSGTFTVTNGDLIIAFGSSLDTVTLGGCCTLRESPSIGNKMGDQVVSGTSGDVTGTVATSQLWIMTGFAFLQAAAPAIVKRGKRGGHWR